MPAVRPEPAAAANDAPTHVRGAYGSAPDLVMHSMLGIGGLFEEMASYGTSRAALIVVHHVRKSIGRYEIGSAFRGSSALHAVGDSYLLLTRPAPQFHTVELRFEPPGYAQGQDVAERALRAAEYLALAAVLLPLLIWGGPRLAAILPRRSRALLRRRGYSPEAPTPA